MKGVAWTCFLTIEGGETGLGVWTFKGPSDFCSLLAVKSMPERAWWMTPLVSVNCAGKRMSDSSPRAPCEFPLRQEAYPARCASKALRIFSMSKTAGARHCGQVPMPTLSAFDPHGTQTWWMHESFRKGTLLSKHIGHDMLVREALERELGLEKGELKPWKEDIV